MDIVKIYQDYSIRSAYENDQHYRDGWVNTGCPHCSGNPGNHLGWNLAGNYFFCWRCGGKSTLQTLSKLLGVSFQEAKNIERKYKSGRTFHNKKIKVIKSKFKMPQMMVNISDYKMALNYMLKRGFFKNDIKDLEQQFHLKAIKSVSIYDNLDLCYRIVAPIIFNKEFVSWQSRDLTNNSSLKYITCPAKREVIEHKKILYNAPEYSNTIVLCEGIFDVFKVFLSGYNSTCCFGVEYTNDQLLLLMKYKRVLIFLDPDKAGRKHTKDFFQRLVFAGINAEMVKNKYNKDPGEMSKKLINECLKPYF